MAYNFWQRDSELAKHVKAERLQRTSDNSTSQFQSANCIQDGNMQPVVAEHQATYGGVTTICNPSHLGQPPSSVAASPLLNQEMALHTIKSAAWQSPRKISSNYPPNSFYDYTFIPSLGSSDMPLFNSPPTMPKPFHYSTHYHHQCPEERYLEPIVNDELQPDASHRPYTCMWYDGHRLCGQTVAEGVTQHMGTFHFMSRNPHYSKITCRWKGCNRSVPFRRDTIVRHILEVHLGKRRRSPKKHIHVD